MKSLKHAAKHTLLEMAAEELLHLIHIGHEALHVVAHVFEHLTHHVSPQTLLAGFVVGLLFRRS